MIIGTISNSFSELGFTPDAKSIVKDFKTLEPVPPIANTNKRAIFISLLRFPKSCVSTICTESSYQWIRADDYEEYKTPNGV
jgi:hypothetical protein